MLNNGYYRFCPLFLSVRRKIIIAKKFAFAKGLATGVVATSATVAGAVFAIKKNIIDPEEEKAAFIQENRKKAARKRVSH